MTLTPCTARGDQAKDGAARPVPEITAMDFACRVAMARYPHAWMRTVSVPDSTSGSTRVRMELSYR